MRPLLALVMIVKDEAVSIRDVLEAAKSSIDCWTILDTGSTDGTQGIIREVMKDVPGTLYEEPFISYAESRNRVLDLSAIGDNAVAEFQIMLSGDEYLRYGTELRKHLEMCREGSTVKVVTPDGREVDASSVDCHFVRVVVDNTALPRPVVFRTGSQWRYQDAGCGVHEFPAHPDPKAPTVSVPNVSIDHIVTDPEKRFSNILDNHIPLLQAAIDKDPINGRALMYLAHSYEILFTVTVLEPWQRLMYAMEAMALYMRRLALPIETEAERNYIKMLYLDTARLTGVYSDGEILSRVKELCEAAPNRPEPALTLIHASLQAKRSGAIELSTEQIYELSIRAANIAAQSKVSVIDSSPMSTACEWQAHHLAAQAALQLAKKYPQAEVTIDGETTSWEKLVRKHVTAGLQAGGKWEIFNRIGNALDTKAPVPAATETAPTSTPAP